MFRMRPQGSRQHGQPGPVRSLQGTERAQALGARPGVGVPLIRSGPGHPPCHRCLSWAGKGIFLQGRTCTCLLGGTPGQLPENSLLWAGCQPSSIQASVGTGVAACPRWRGLGVGQSQPECMDLHPGPVSSTAPWGHKVSSSGAVRMM